MLSLTALSSYNKPINTLMQSVFMLGPHFFIFLNAGNSPQLANVKVKTSIADPNGGEIQRPNRHRRRQYR